MPLPTENLPGYFSYMYMYPCVYARSHICAWVVHTLVKALSGIKPRWTASLQNPLPKLESRQATSLTCHCSNSAPCSPVSVATAFQSYNWPATRAMSQPSHRSHLLLSTFLLKLIKCLLKQEVARPHETSWGSHRARVLITLFQYYLEEGKKNNKQTNKTWL